MGLFDGLFKGQKIEEVANNDIAKLTQEIKSLIYSDSQSLQDFMNKYNRSNIYCDEILYWENIKAIVKKDINFQDGYKVCRDLFNLIVLEPNNENDIRKFKKFRDLLLNKEILNNSEINSNQIIDNFKKMYMLFNDKEACYYIYSDLFKLREGENLNKIKIETSNDIINYMIETRNYFNDEKAFISSVLDVINKISEQSYNNETRIQILEAAKIKARQLAGFYEIDEVMLAQLPEEVKTKIKDLNTRYDNLVNAFARKESAINVQIDEAEKEFKKRVSGIIGESDETIAKVEAVKIEAIKQIDGLQKSIVNSINNFLGMHPEGEAALRSLDTGYIELLDTNISAERRFAKAIQLKNPKEFYVGAYDEALKLALIDQPILLQGPSGCGKSTIAKQICETLGLKFINFGFIVDEFSGIKGYMDANNNYVKTSFYDCYKYGGGFFIDEIDNSKPEALLDLNKITGTNGYEPYTFPNGETVKPHPNFRLFAAANTFGEGGNVLYKRNALDASTLDRFSIVKVNYNEELEKWIMKDYIDVYEFLVTMRNVITSTHSNKLVTTKTMSDIRKCLDSRIINLEEALATKLIKGENPESLLSICENVKSEIPRNDVVNAFERAIEKDKVKRK